MARKSALKLIVGAAALADFDSIALELADGGANVNADLDSVDGDGFAAGGANVNAGFDSVSAGFVAGVAAKLNAGFDSVGVVAFFKSSSNAF